MGIKVRLEVNGSSVIYVEKLEADQWTEALHLCLDAIRAHYGDSLTDKKFFNYIDGMKTRYVAPKKLRLPRQQKTVNGDDFP